MGLCTFSVETSCSPCNLQSAFEEIVKAMDDIGVVTEKVRADNFLSGRTIFQSNPSCGQAVILTSVEHWMDYTLCSRSCTALTENALPCCKL